MVLLPRQIQISLLAFVWTALACPAATSLSFNRDVRPILSGQCLQCHGPDSRARKAGLRLDVPEEAFQPRADGPAIVPGNLSASALITRIHSTDPEEQMPPPDSGKMLSDEERAILTRWIEAGAQYERHWSFIPPRQPDLPVMAEASGVVQNGIDTFILDRLKNEGLEPMPEASKETLIRRASLDLTGMPPAPEDINAFLADSSEYAYESLLDCLLASPRYGEHMASSWLDSARYSDTNGYNNDTPRYNWRYRDWVIEAFNRNLP